MIFLDCESCGLHGMAVLLQYAEEDGPVVLYEIWKRPVQETLELIERIASQTVVGFNLVFDHFHLCKIYTIFRLVQDKATPPQIEEIAQLEPLGRDGPCLKPQAACDIMLHARKGPYQSVMPRGDIRIKRVPAQLAEELARELEQRVPLSGIYFAKRKKPGPQWQTEPTDDPAFRNVLLRFKPSSSLKALARDALQLDQVTTFEEIELDCYPKEVGYAPFALAVGRPGAWNGAWPDVIARHISHWASNDQARDYATKDVIYTRALYDYFGKPAAGDDDSELACMVAAVRWRGFAIDIEGIEQLRDEAVAATRRADGWEIPTYVDQVREYVGDVMDPVEKLCAGVIEVEPAEDDYAELYEHFQHSTKKVLLEKIAKFPARDGQPHPAAVRAREVLQARQAKYLINFLDKLLLAGRFHASLNVIGALSSRMSGADDLNAQGIKKGKQVRSKFPLAWPGYSLGIGDFAGFEVTLADAAYGDPGLRADLQSYRPCHVCRTAAERFNCKECHGTGQTKTKIHALFGTCVYPDMTYEQILATDGTEDNKYTRCKSALFALLYGGEGYTLMDRLGVDLDVANAAYHLFCHRYPQIGRVREQIAQRFRTIQSTEHGLEYQEPGEYVESLFGFRRYFTLENQISKALYELAQNPPPSWAAHKQMVQRKDRWQTIVQATQSALYAAIFTLQGSLVRAALNHQIQSSGATLTKHLQRQIWDLQPAGVHEFVVMCLNIHDEVACPVRHGYEEQVAQIVKQTVASFRDRVPLIEMEWKTHAKNWAEK